MKTGTYLFFIVIIAITLRFIYLGVIPLGITHDEMGYIYNAYSIAKTGKNVFGEFLPFFTWMNTGGFPFMPVPIYSMVPLFWIFPLTPTIARLIPAVLGVLDVVLLFYIVRAMFRNTNLALISALFLAISPWHLHFSRSAYDANYSLFYFLLAIAAFFYELSKNKLPLLTIPLFILAIFSYRGMSIIFIPLVVVLFLYARATRSISSRQSLVFWAGICVSIVLFIIPIRIYGNTYTAEGIALFRNPKIQEDIDTQIREAKGPLIIRRIFTNKPTYIIDRFRENFIKAYSPEFLFLYTEPSAIYSIWSRGRIYFIDIFFIMFGIAFLFHLNRKSAWLWCGLLFIGGLPGGIGGMPYSSRNLFLAAIFPVFSAGGVLYGIKLMTNKLARTFMILLICMLYIYALGSYLYDYYGRYAHQGAEGWAKSIKDISLLAQQESNNADMVILGKTSFGDLVEYAFWNRIDPLFVQETWKNRRTEPPAHFLIGTILYRDSCLNQNDLRELVLKKQKNIYYITTHSCHKAATPSRKIEDFFGNPIWKTYEIDLQDPKSYIML